MKILTLNLRHDEDRWSERYPLATSELLKEQPDVIALQEVALGTSQAHQIAEELNGHMIENPYQVYVAKKQGLCPIEGIAFLIRMQVLEYQEIVLPGGIRVAQYVRVEQDETTVDIVNTHLHHLPKDDEIIRLDQANHLLKWIHQEREGSHRWVLVGDFNASPLSETILEVRKHFASAYQSVHGNEPDFTFPTPLATGIGSWYQPRTIDYVFFDPIVFRASEARLTFKDPHPYDNTLFPSDHFGLVVTLSL